MRSDKNKIIYILIIMIIMMVMNNQDIEAQDKPKPPPPPTESERREAEERERRGPILSLEALERIRSAFKYTGIIPSHKGIDVSNVLVRGKKFCDVEVHEEAIMLRGYVRRTGNVYDHLIDIYPSIKETKLWNPNEIRQMIYITDNEKDLVAFVFDKGIMVLMYDNIDKNYFQYYIAMPKDGSKIFLNSVFIASTKDIIATTPTTYIVAGKKGKFVESYDELVGHDTPDLKNPTIREGKPGVIYIKDEVMNEFRVEIYTSDGLKVGVDIGD